MKGAEWTRNGIVQFHNVILQSYLRVCVGVFVVLLLNHKISVCQWIIYIESQLLLISNEVLYFNFVTSSECNVTLGSFEWLTLSLMNSKLRCLHRESKMFLAGIFLKNANCHLVFGSQKSKLTVLEPVFQTAGPINPPPPSGIGLAFEQLLLLKFSLH